jgi:release factor glutamine methyltransferase
MRDSGWPEPRLALDGGETGLDLLLRLAEESVERLRENGYLLMEASDDQAETLAEIYRIEGYREVRTLHDLAGRRRLTVGRRGP